VIPIVRKTSLHYENQYTNFMETFGIQVVKPGGYMKENQTSMIQVNTKNQEAVAILLPCFHKRAKG